MATKHVTILLDSLECWDTEDVWYKDEFFGAGGAGTGPLSGKKWKSILTAPPISIRGGQTKKFNKDTNRLFDAAVDVDDFIAIGIAFYDEDFTTVDYPGWLGKIVTMVAKSVQGAVGKQFQRTGESKGGAVAGLIAAAIITAVEAAVVQAYAYVDKPDLLCEVKKTIDMQDLVKLTEGKSYHYSWEFWDHKRSITETGLKTSPTIVTGNTEDPASDADWSKYHYRVNYEIIVTS